MATGIIFESLLEHPQTGWNVWEGGEWNGVEGASVNSITRSTDVARAGSYSAKFVLNKTDALVAGSYRSELTDWYGRMDDPRSERWYGFSIFLPASYITDPCEEILCQWHSQNGNGANDLDGVNMLNPAMALRTRNGNWELFNKFQSVADLGACQTNAWTDWVIHVKFSPDGLNGLLEVWKNSVKVFTSTQKNTYNDTLGNYFKLGIYKYGWNDGYPTTTTSRTLYFDEIRTGDQTSDYFSVSPPIPMAGTLITYEPFETLNWVDNYYPESAVAARISRSNAVAARNGAYAGRFELNKTDGDVGGSKRTEVATQFVGPATGWDSSYGPNHVGDFWYAFSVFLPTSYVYDQSAELIYQIHAQGTTSVDGFSMLNPPLALLTSQGKWMLNNKFNATQNSYDLGPYQVGVWTDVVIHYKMSWGSDGLLQVWKDGAKVHEHSGQNYFHTTEGFFQKIGVYKWDWATGAPSDTTQRILYFDEFRIGESDCTYDDMAPRPARPAIGTVTSTSPNIDIKFSTYGTKTGVLKVRANGVTVEKAVSVNIKPPVSPALAAYEQGYAWHEGAVTGGAAGSTVHAYNYDQLRTYLRTVAPLIIIWHGVISGTSATVNFGYSCEGNKTIIGAPGAVMKGFSLTWRTKTNILIRNIICQDMPDFLAAGTSKRDFFTFTDNTDRFCVNHCTMIGNKGTDSLLDVTDGCDYFTISDNIYQNDDKGSLVGARDIEPLDVGKLRGSFFRNYWIDIAERSPSYRIGAGCDVMNNLYESRVSTWTSGYAIGSRCGAIVRARSNDFSMYIGHGLQCIDGLDNTAEGVPIPYGRFSDISTNIFGTGSNVLKGTTESTWQPPYDTSFEIPVGQVKQQVQQNAGATLTLAQMGY